MSNVLNIYKNRKSSQVYQKVLKLFQNNKRLKARVAVVGIYRSLTELNNSSR